MMILKSCVEYTHTLMRSVFCILTVSILFNVLPGHASSKWVKPLDELGTQKKITFWTGFSLFRSPWVAAPASTVGRDGLGPLFNARSCDACHHNGAAGKTPGEGFGALVRLSIFDKLNNKYIDEPRYGNQLQTLSIHSIIGESGIAAEGNVDIEWVDVDLEIDGKLYPLKKPNVVISNLQYGELDPDVKMSLRTAPPLFGLGIVDALPNEDILKYEDINDKDKDGVSGRAHWVWDIAKKQKSLGRFGHKSEQPNLLQQIASAFNADIGLTSWLFEKQNCTEVQSDCIAAPNGNSPEEGVEISRAKLEIVQKFSAHLMPPKTSIESTISNSTASKSISSNSSVSTTKTSSAPLGSMYFEKVGCNACHISKAVALNANIKILSHKKVRFFSDFLLHDMGKELSDERPVGDAKAEEWRTTPLWGISRKLKKHVQLLHDGRAKDVHEAILWHAGEGRHSRKRYLELTLQQQALLLEFVESL